MALCSRLAVHSWCSALGLPSARLARVLFLLFSKEKGEMEEAIFSCVWVSFKALAVVVDTYFLGTPSPKLPIQTNVFSKMKTLSKDVELKCCCGTQAYHVRMVSSTCSVESAWLASFFRDLRLHSFSTSKLATSRILERDWKHSSPCLILRRLTIAWSL